LLLIESAAAAANQSMKINKIPAAPYRAATALVSSHRVCSVTRLVCIVLLCSGFAATAHAAGSADGCREYFPVTFTAGFGDTFRFWQNLRSSVIPLTVTWGCDRYEFGVFRFGNQYQKIDGVRQLIVAQDYATSLTRRWVLHRWGTTSVLFGLGGSYRTRAGLAEGNPFNGSHLNFAEQVGVRWTRSGHREGVELSFRHFSNLGIVRPNIGQNFVDLALVF
jgi:hypothetical protein